MTPPAARVLGAILAGGAGRRYGAPKALAAVAGVPMAERARRALAGQVERVVLVGSGPAAGAGLGLPVIPDAVRGRGPAAGLHAALLEAREGGLDGAFVLACDLPLVTGALVALLLGRREGERAVVPESAGPLGFEPLCAWYGVGCLDVVEDPARQGGGSMESLADAVGAARVPLRAVAEVADPATVFLNVNTPADRERAEAILAGREGSLGD